MNHLSKCFEFRTSYTKCLHKQIGWFYNKHTVLASVHGLDPSRIWGLQLTGPWVLCLSSWPLLLCITTEVVMLFSQNDVSLLWTMSGVALKMAGLFMPRGFFSWQVPAYSSLVSETISNYKLGWTSDIKEREGTYLHAGCTAFCSSGCVVHGCTYLQMCATSINACLHDYAPAAQTWVFLSWVLCASYMCTCLCMCKWQWMHVHICVHMCLCLRTCDYGCMHLFVPVSACQYMRTYMWLWMWL